MPIKRVSKRNVIVSRFARSGTSQPLLPMPRSTFCPTCHAPLEDASGLILTYGADALDEHEIDYVRCTNLRCTYARPRVATP